MWNLLRYCHRFQRRKKSNQISLVQYIVIFQCYFLWFAIFLLITPIALTSDLVQSIKYMRHSTVLAYETLDIYSDSSYELGCNYEDNLKWETDNILIGFTLSILNLSNTF